MSLCPTNRHTDVNCKKENKALSKKENKAYCSKAEAFYTALRHASPGRASLCGPSVGTTGPPWSLQLLSPRPDTHELSDGKLKIKQRPMVTANTRLSASHCSDSSSGNVLYCQWGRASSLAATSKSANG